MKTSQRARPKRVPIEQPSPDHADGGREVVDGLRIQDVSRVQEGEAPQNDQDCSERQLAKDRPRFRWTGSGLGSSGERSGRGWSRRVEPPIVAAPATEGLPDLGVFAAASSSTLVVVAFVDSVSSSVLGPSSGGGVGFGRRLRGGQVTSIEEHADDQEDSGHHELA